MLNDIGYIIKSSGAFGPFLFDADRRLLLPFGLHHILTAMIMLEGLGMKDNIISLDNCAARLGLVVIDMTLIDEEKLKL